MNNIKGIQGPIVYNATKFYNLYESHKWIIHSSSFDKSTINAIQEMIKIWNINYKNSIW